jgi:chemotaxis protein methyltransferase CheR
MCPVVGSLATPSPPRAAAGQASAPAEREFEFTDADFERIRRLIRLHAGIALTPAKRNLAYSRISRLVRGSGLVRFVDYLDAIEQGAAPGGVDAFVNALTTNLTSFFREAHHFPIFADHLARAARRPARVWCAAASTGEEPYSIAIAACESFGSLSPPVQIVASDIDTQVLAAAAQGVYPLERVEALGPARLRRFFQRGTGPHAGFARVRAELRALVEFRRVNLLDSSWDVHGPLAALFCRNVLIYFDRATQSRIVARLAPLLDAGGLLFAGHSESLAYAREHFRLRGHTVYESAGEQR